MLAANTNMTYLKEREGDVNRSRTHSAKEHIAKHFNSLGKKVFTKKELSLLLAEKRASWKLASSESVNKFIDHLVEMHLLKTAELTCPHYQHSFTRYIWGPTVPIYSLALSWKNHAYLSHQSACHLHGLTNRIPQIVYVNFEQSKKERTDSH